MINRDRALMIQSLDSCSPLQTHPTRGVDQREDFSLEIRSKTASLGACARRDEVQVEITSDGIGLGTISIVASYT